VRAGAGQDSAEIQFTHTAAKRSRRTAEMGVALDAAPHGHMTVHAVLPPLDQDVMQPGTGADQQLGDRHHAALSRATAMFLDNCGNRLRPNLDQ